MTSRPARPRTLLDFINRPILKGVAPAGNLKRVFTGKSGQNRKKNFGRVMYASETIQNCKNPTGHIDTLKKTLLQNGYPRGVISYNINDVLDKQKDRLAEPTTTVPKKDVILALPYLGFQSEAITRRLKSSVSKFYGFVNLRVIF